MVKNSGVGDNAPEAMGGLVSKVDEVKPIEVAGELDPPKSGPVDKAPDPIPGVPGNPDEDPDDFDADELRIELNAAVEELVDRVRTT